MNEKISLKSAYRLIAVFTAVSAVLLFILFTAFFDPDSGYFDTSTNATIVKSLFAISSVFCFAISLIPAKLQEIHSEKKVILLSPVATQVAAAAVIVLGAFQIAITSLGLIHPTPKAYQLCGLGCIAFGVYLLLRYKQNFSVPPIVFLALLALGCTLPIGTIIGINSTYTRHINSVENTLTVAFSIFYMLYILYEEKLLRGMTSRFYISSALLTSSSGITFSVAYIGAYLFGSVHESARFVQAFLILAISAAVLASLFTDANFSAESDTSCVSSNEEKETPD